MTVTFEFWQVLVALAAVTGAFGAVFKLLLDQHARNMERALDAIRDDSAEWKKLERRFLEHLAELPVNYVRRDDYVRGQTVIEAKLDAVASGIKLVQFQGGKT